ncbi:unnamed protein product [Didymodactylos carnosus]|uniref:ATP synthase F(0) complex subunit e, mitochondrial n=1 Tax=Didymodactylos carnosus TaxID=1234261 RepID=A0A813NEK2_9BILA|nr:unnamed protein product [Didymodactylos carnosus]CAF0784157.1 unnamed protein product [Didymodactylos carnosus]CAF3515571.1 unnamed protein product [Didymodactylos carnosus]CAF3566166.1 unnamed protein product [Didymodactylos carnosus]
MSTAVPKNVSPFIRACRWGLLLTGVVYGRSHYKTVKAKEEKVHEKEIDKATHHYIQKLGEKKIMGEQSMIELARAAGVDPNRAQVKQQIIDKQHNDGTLVSASSKH